jgi:tetratricopeptide (TPR) repeat protein
MRTANFHLPGILLFCLAAPAFAGDEAATTAPEPELRPTATTAELAAIAEQYEQQVAQMESQYGAYDPRLGEQLLSQGRVYQQLQEHAKALEALKRAFHIQRVTTGVQNLGQVPILQRILESNITLHDWPAVDQNFDQLLWIYRRNYADGDQQLLDVFNQVGRWKIQAYRDGLLKSDGYTTVSDAAFMFAESIKLTEQRYGETDPRLIDLLYGHSVASYQAMIEYANRPLDKYVDRQASSAITYVQKCVPVVMPNGRVAMQCFSVPVMNVGTWSRAQDEKDMDVERRFVAARKSLERIVAIHDAHGELPAESRAEALTHLGDWYTLRGSEGKAMEYYQKAWQLLQGLPDGDKKQQALFGNPVPVPALRLAVASVDKQVAPENPPNFVAVSYDVSKSGRVHNAQVTEKSAEVSAAAGRRVLDVLRKNRFRPRLENGVAVDTLGAVKRYPVN